MQNKMGTQTLPSNIDEPTKISSIWSTSLRGIKKLRMKQAKQSKIDNILQSKAITVADQDQKSQLLSTQASKSIKESIFIKRKHSLCSQVDREKQRQYLVRLQQAKYRGEPSVIYLTSSEPETLVDFNNTCFLKRAYHSSHKLRFNLITYSTFQHKKTLKTEPTPKQRASVNEMVRLKLAHIRNYENAKLTRHDVMASCTEGISCQGGNKKMAKMFQSQQYQQYQLVAHPTPIKF